MTRVVTDPHWTFNLLPAALRDLGVVPHGVIHVGAHRGQEVPVYLKCRFGRIVLVEPDPALCELIRRLPWAGRVELVQAAVAPTAGTATFYQVGDGAWSGLKRNPTRPPASDQFDVPTLPLAELQAVHPGCNVLVIDTQGTELEALASADLTAVDLVVVETQDDGIDGAHPDRLREYAEAAGWEMAVVWDRTGGWTDTLLVPRRSRG